MSTSLSNLVENLFKGFHNNKCEASNSYLDYASITVGQLIFRCFESKNIYKRDFNKDLVKRFSNIYEFCDRDINKFVLLLRKEIYPYEYMDNWERFDETLLSENEYFYSSLNMEGITNVDYRHAKRVFKGINNKI